ncbi:MAG: acyl-ACP--UDP-N-acetylglucosamine O-acyltransferase [bacterium]
MLKSSDTCQIHPGARIGRDVTIGPYSIIGEDVAIGDGTTIGSHVVIEGWTEIGTENRIHHFAVLGGPPQDLKFSGSKSFLRVGNRNTIREFATLNRATAEGEETRVGDGNLIMTYVHIAHNCVVENNVILANAVNLAGHVHIEENAIIGGGTVVHQFVRIGGHSMVGGGSRIPKDVPPYSLGAGNDFRIAGINQVGLDRRGFPEESKRALKEAFRLLYRGSLNRSQAIERIQSDLPACPEIAHLIRFLEGSQRGAV